MNGNDPENCGCCAGTETVTPEPVANRPGQDALRYRIGTHATFLESMQARLSSLCLGSAEDNPSGQSPVEDCLQAPKSEQECRQGQGSYPLRALATRSPDDPAMAMLDAFAVMGDVLTFYQERIANEGYLRTALERRSVLELARLVGYQLRPGVAASVFLAYEMETGQLSLIPRGARVQSTPGPNEDPQTFETAADLSARYEWNSLTPRQTKSLAITLANGLSVEKLYFATPAANLKPNDALLLIFDDQPAHQVLRRVQEVKVDFAQANSVVTLQPVPALVIVLVELLQMAEGILSADLPNLRGSKLDSFAPGVEDVILLLDRLLENLRLGNYPQPHIDLSFDQINILASLISALGDRTLEDKDRAEFVAQLVLLVEDPFIASIIRSIIARLKSNTIEKAVVLPPLPTVSKPFQIYLADLFIPLLARTHQVLTTPWVRHELTCALSQLIIQGGADYTARRKLLLESLGDDKQKIFYDMIRELRPNLEKSDKEFNQFSNLAVRLLDDLAGIPWQPAAASQVRDVLSNLNLEFKADDDHDFTIYPIITRSHHYHNESARTNLDGLLGLLKKVPKEAEVPCTAPGEKRVLLADLIEPLSLAPATHPASPAFLARTPGQAFGTNADATPRMLLSFTPELRESLYAAWAAAALPAALPPLQAVHALRLTAAPFGYNAPQKTRMVSDDDGGPPFKTVPDIADYELKENPLTLFTDSQYDGILPGSYMIIRKADSELMAVKIAATTARPRTDYSMSAKTTRLTLKRALWNNDNDGMDTLRSTSLYGQSEGLPLAPVPDPSPIKEGSIELDGLYNDLDSGRWLIVSGERADIPGVDGVQASELVMLLGVTHSGGPEKAASPDGKASVHTTLTLSSPLNYIYKRASVLIYANVVKATQGETRNEVLGSGDAGQPFQKFALRQPPLTFIAAPTPSGTVSTLEVRVNDLLWREASSPFGLEANHRSYLTSTDDQGVTTVLFGDGRRGARPPTGVENITALYRNGIGKGGNVRKAQISLMLTRPLHARNVTNPLPATGGADPDSRDQARRNVPKSVAALDRLVSVRDYADFANTYAGIGKASAADLFDGHRRVVQVCIAGIGDNPISPDSDLFHSLYDSLLAYGDPHQPVRLALRELLLLVLSADVSLLPEYSWEKVKPILSDALFTEFGFEKRELGQPVVLSKVTAAIQAVPGVEFVVVQALNALDRETIIQNLPDPTQPLAQNLATLLGLKPKDQIPVEMDRYDRESGKLLSAQIAYLSREIPETLILNLREG